MVSLRKMYGKEIPEPSGYLVTRWNQDPSGLGSYSYVPVGSKQSLRRQIGMPVENRIFFAGEATSQYFPSTVHGAFLSGVRAAYEIMLADTKEDLMETALDRLISTCEAVPASSNNLTLVARGAASLGQE